MKKFLRAFKTQAEYIAFTASTEFILDNVSSCREGDLVYFNSEQCGGQGIHRTISGETYCDGYDKRVYLYKQVSYDDGVTWETIATTSSLVEKNSEDCGYVPPTPPSDWDITAKFNVTSTSSPTQIAYITTGFSKIEIDDVEQPSVVSAYTFGTLGEHTVKYRLTDPTTIGTQAFLNCSSLTSCTIGSGVTTIGNDAFYYCSGLTSVDISSGVTSIGDSAFYGCSSLTSATIGTGLTSIGRSAFSNCSSLASMTVDSNNAVYDSRSNCNAIIETSTNTLIAGCKNTVIPNSVTTIGGYAFFNCTSLTSIDIPNTVTIISNNAFYGCSSLTSIDIPNSVTTIGGYAFFNCSSLTSITVEATTPATLGARAFDNTNNCPIYVPCDSVEDYKAAEYWSTYASRIKGRPLVTSVELDTNTLQLLEYETHAFSATVLPLDACDNSVTWSSSDSNIVTVDSNGVASGVSTGNATVTVTTVDGGFTDSCSLTVGNNYKVISYRATSKLRETTSTSWANGLHVNSFSGTSGQKLTMVSHTFEDGVGTIVFNDEVASIGNYAYNSCSGLTSIEIPDSVTSIGHHAFFACGSLTSIEIPDNVTSIDYDAFYDCSGLTSCTIGSGVTSIGDNAFTHCFSLTSVDIPDSVTSIGTGTFYGCTSLTSCTIGNGVTSIGTSVFNSCSGLTSVDISSGVTSIGDSAFTHCFSLTSCTIGSGVTSIGNDAFSSCSGLTSIEIPSAVTSIGQYAFRYCSGLTSITVESTTPPTLGSNAFDNTNNCPIYVPCDSVDAYKAASVWSTYASRIQAIQGSCPIVAIFNVTNTSSPTRIMYSATTTSYYYKIEIDGVEKTPRTGYTFDTTGEHTVKYYLRSTNVGESVFYSCGRLTSVTIPDSVTVIDYGAFRGCTNLSSCTIGSGVTSIGNYAFANCTYLTSIDIPSGVTSIGEHAFEDCHSLTSVTIGSGVTSIGNNAFYRATSLTNIDIPDSVTSIGSGMCYYCSGLTSCTIGSGVTRIGYQTFYHCSSLTSIDIPSGVTSIGNSAFTDCSGLTSISIPSGVTTIGGSAFYNCTGLTSVTVKATTPPTLGTYVFTSTNNCPIYVPCDSVDTYKAATNNWRTWTSRIQAIPGSCP